jgi:hypothetical protein
MDKLKWSRLFKKKNTLIIFPLLIVVIIAFSDRLFNKISSKGIFTPSGVYGDLYELTHLGNFKEHNYIEQSTLPIPHFSEKHIEKDKNLYIIGDSFTKGIDLRNFIANKTAFIRIGVNSSEVALDKKQKNILIIQNVERGIVDRFRDNQYETTFEGLSGYYTKETKRKLDTPSKEGNVPAMLKDFGTANIEDRLQYLCFKNKFSEGIKEFKSGLNFMLFGRIDGMHVLSKNEKFLYYRNEASVEERTSSFYPLEDKIIKECSNNATKITKYYHSMGFDEVYFVFVPNKVSICSPEDHQYNHQIERIQLQQNPTFKVIDLYSEMVNRQDFYHKGDGHWNKKGMALFVKKVNEILN